MVGSPNKRSVAVEGINKMSLIDTGSTVSNISRSFYDENLQHIGIQSLQSIISIECADGQLLPYDGFIECNFKLSGMIDNDSKLVNGLFLIVPSSKYISKVPVILGTNLLSVLLERTKRRYGKTYSQDADLHHYI